MFRALTTWQLVVDAVLAALFLATCGMLPVVAGGPAASIAPSLLLAAALAVRRLSPPLALAGAWAGAIVQMAMGLTPLPADLAVFGVLYATAAYGSTLVFWLGLASSFVGAAVIAAYLVLVLPAVFYGSSLTWGDLPVALLTMAAAMLGLLLAWTAGALARTARRARANRVARERAEADAAAEQERARIARDMHDVVAHSLAVVIAQADGARYAAASDPAIATRALGTISATARSALTDVRMLLTQLRPSHPPLSASSPPRGVPGERGPGQGAGPQPALADLGALYDQVRAAGVDLRVEVAQPPSGEPPAAVQLAVYRILQEALTNALRHGGPGAVTVRLAWHPHRLELSVRNPLRPGGRPAAPGHGLIGMGERARLVGGRLNTADERGEFVVTALLPTGGPA